MSILKNQQNKGLDNHSGSKVQLMSESRKNTMDDKIEEENINAEDKKSSSVKD